MDSSKVLKNLLQLQNQMKLYHWQTDSYARHKGSDKFVTKAIDIIDRIIESYQGSHEVIKLKNSNKKIELENITDKDIVAFLKQMKTFMIQDFPQILNANQDTDLLNLRDEMLENIDITLYLFRLK